MAQKKILASIELPEVQDSDNSPSSGFKRLYASADKLRTKTSLGVDKALWYEDDYSSLNETNPVYTYSGEDLVRIDYASGNYKVFTYLNSNLVQLDYVKTQETYRKSFTYDLNSNLTSILYSVV